MILLASVLTWVAITSWDASSVYADGRISVVAHTTRTMAARDTAKLHVVASPGSSLFEEGKATGTLPGQAKVHFDLGPIVTASFQIETKYGTIRGHGSGRLRKAGVYSTFGGTAVITSGTGRYAHVVGSGGLYGAINRFTDNLTVQTTGTITY
jgi:hypothetical protein